METVPVPSATSHVDTSATPKAVDPTATERPAAVDLGGVEERLDTINGAVQGFHERAEQYETIIRKMQSKIEDLQSDQVRTLLKPVIIRLAALFTEASRLSVEAAERGEKKTQKDFGYYADEIEESLELLDIESLDVKVGADFDASKQAARGTQATDDPALDRKVAAVVRQGFTYVGVDRPMLPAVVKIYKYTEAATPAASESTSTEGAH